MNLLYKRSLLSTCFSAPIFRQSIRNYASRGMTQSRGLPLDGNIADPWLPSSSQPWYLWSILKERFVKALRTQYS
jgi:hypothetical protein